MKPATVAAALVLLAHGATTRASCLQYAGRGHTNCEAYSDGSDAHTVPPLWSDGSIALHVQSLGPLALRSAGGMGLPAYTIPAGALPAAQRVFAAHTRVALQVGRWLYLGAEGGFGQGAVVGPTVALGVTESVAPQYLQYLSLGALAGTCLTAGRFMFRFELVAGARDYGLASTLFYRELTVTDVADALQPFASTRAQAEWWLGAGVSLGVWAGAEFAVGSDVGFVTGLALAGHFRTMDGSGDR